MKNFFRIEYEDCCLDMTDIIHKIINLNQIICIDEKKHIVHLTDGLHYRLTEDNFEALMYYIGFEKKSDDSESEDERKFNDTNPDKIMFPIFGDSFHGEEWYKCPRCGESFEVYDTEFERGFRRTSDPRTFRHIQNGCNQLIRIN